MKSRNKIKRFLTVTLMNNIGYKILSVVIAVLVWIIVINLADPVITRSFSGLEVEVLNQSAITSINQVYEIVEGSTIDFVVKGKVSVVNNLKVTDFHAYADLSQLSPVYATDIVVKCERTSNIEIDTKNKMMVVKLEEIDTKNMQVAVETVGEVARGYYVGDYEVKPNMVTVTGGISKIKEIDSVKVSVNVDGAKKNFSSSVEPIAYDKDGNMIDSSNFSLSNGGMKISNVSVNITVFRTKTIPVLIKVTGTPDENYVYTGEYEYTPESIEISGAPRKIKNIEHIEIPVDINGAVGNYEVNIPFSDYLPEGVETVNSEGTISVRVKLEAIAVKEIRFDSDDIDKRNIPEQCVITELDEGKIYTVIISGTRHVIDNVTIEKLKPYIDLKNVNEGECRLQVQYDGVGQFNIVGEPQMVGINVNKVDNSEENSDNIFVTSEPSEPPVFDDLSVTAVP